MVANQKNDMLLAADPIKGKALCSLCFACHNDNKGEPSKGEYPVKDASLD